MNKPVFGLSLGAALGIFDGLTAWFTPAVRPFLMGIVIGSTFKGLIAGVCAGYFANKVRSVPLGILFGLGGGYAAGLRSSGDAQRYRGALLFRDHAARKHSGRGRGLCDATIPASRLNTFAGR